MVPAEQALAGIVIADFSRVLAGPLATMTLGDLGADVIKVERPRTGDDTRAWGPPFVGEGSAYYLGLNRNKRSIALDLADPADLETARALVARADVVVENFRPGTMARYGLGYDQLAAQRPEIVYCSISAFGSGPEGARMPGYDFLVQAASGFMSVTGERDGTPLKVGVAVVDVLCGLYATIGVLTALRARDRTGQGELVEVSLMDAGLSALINQASAYLLAGVVPRPLGNRHPSIVPYQTYDAADRPVALAVGSDSLFARLCAELGLDDVAADERFATNAARVAHVDELSEILGGIFARVDAATWVERLGRAGVPAGLVNDVREAFALAERLGLDPVAEVRTAGDEEELRLVRSPLRLSETPADVERPPPRLDEHAREIRDWLAGSGAD